MSPPPPERSAPILPRPHWIRGRGDARLLGDGELALSLSGTGRVVLRLSPGAQFRFDGEGVRRLPSPDRIDFLAATGLLVVSGTGIDVETFDATVIVALMGRFEVTLSGRGEVTTAAGERTGWGLRPKTLHVDGTVCREAPPRGGIAA
jgi:hypothetical protein